MPSRTTIRNEMVRARCRQRLSLADLTLTAEILGGGTCHSSIMALMSDPEARDIMLDDRRLYKAVRSERYGGLVSTRMYLYVLLRQHLLEAGLNRRGLTDYVAEMLTVYSQSVRTRRVTRKGPFRYMEHLSRCMEKLDGFESFAASIHVANYALFIAGVAPERLCLNVNPDTDTMIQAEMVGRSNYLAGSRAEFSQSFNLGRIYRELGSNFRLVRTTLNQMGEFCLFDRQGFDI